jgi:putative transposase
MSQDLVSYSSSLGCSRHHISFIPKYRNDIFSYSRIKAVCEYSFYETAAEYRFRIIELGFGTDHVHLIVDIPPHLSISAVVKLLKGRSAKKLFKAFPWLKVYSPNEPRFWGGNFWSGAYYFDSVGSTTTEVMQNYVKSQGMKGDEQRRLNHFMPPTKVGGC